MSADPALIEGKYFPKPNDYDTEHDFYWYLQQDGSKKLPGIGGVFNAVNLDVYHYAGQNPVKLVDPDGRTVYGVFIEAVITGTVGVKATSNMILFDDKNFDIYISPLNINPTFWIMYGGGLGGFKASCDTVQDYLNQHWVSLEGSIWILGGELGISNSKEGGLDIMKSIGFGKARPKFGIQLNVYSDIVNIGIKPIKINDKKMALKIFNELFKAKIIDAEMLNKAIKIWDNRK